MIIGYFNKKELKVFVDYYFDDNGLKVCRQLGYFDYASNWSKVITNQELKNVFENITLESLNINNIDYLNPPKLSPYAVEIPKEYRWVFPQDKFILNNFEVPLDTYQNTKVVNLAYFEWDNFRAELDRKDEDGIFIYATLKRSLMELWDYVALQVSNNNIIVL